MSLSQCMTGPLEISTLCHLLEPISVPLGGPKSQFVNWGQTYRCRPLCIFEPETEQQCALILELARREGKKVRFAGVGHSPSDLACTNEYMLRTTKLNSILEINVEKHYVVAQGGIILHALNKELSRYDLAMSNLGSISDQTLGGAIMTATHGSGVNFGVLSTQVLEVTMLLADGTKVTCSASERPNLFHASLCGLGATGLILSVKILVEPAFLLRDSQETFGFDEIVDNLDTLVISGEHVRFWWFAQSGKVRLSVCDRTVEPIAPAGTWLWHRLFGYHFIQFMLFIGRFFLFVNTWAGCFAEWLISGKSIGVDVSYRIFNVECRYPQHTTEWAIPFRNAQSCLRALRAWLDEEYTSSDGLRPHFPIEVRFSAADNIWLSPSYGQITCWIGIVQYKPYGFNVPYRQLFQRYETILAQHGGRPHWAKAHALRPKDLHRLYPKFNDFLAILEEVDPIGLFCNEYIRRHIFGEDGPETHSRVFKSRK